MQKHYLHLSVYSCDACAGPVVAGWVAIRESEISKETDIRQVGAICLTCGHRQGQATEPQRARHFPPMEWNPPVTATKTTTGSDPLTTPLVEALSRVELR